MKLIVDSCLSRRVARALSEAGHAVIWVGDGSDPGDAAILSQGFLEGRVVLTLDKDFGELAELHGLPHAGIIRILNTHPRQFVPTFPPGSRSSWRRSARRSAGDGRVGKNAYSSGPHLKSHI